MPAVHRSALPYLIAGLVPIMLIPILIGKTWPGIGTTRPFAAYVLFLCIAVIGRVFGFEPALLCAGASAFALWNVLLTTTHPLHVSIVRVILFSVASVVIASVSRKRSEEVREAEDRYRALVELSPDAIGMSDEESRIVFANAAYARLLGAADASQLLGRKTTDFVHPDSADRVRKRIDLLATGQPAPLFAVKWVKLDGSVIDVETAGVRLHRNGKVFYQGFIRDLTERNKAVARNEENQRRMQALFDTALDAVLFVDSAGHWVDANHAACELFGHTRDEILEMKVGDLTPEDQREATAKVWREVTTRGKLQEESTIRRKDGRILDVEYRAVANVIPGLHCVFMHDITARKEAESTLHQLSSRLLRLQDEERRRIARQLHDTTAQNLAALKMNLSRISSFVGDPAIRDSVQQSIELTEKSIGEIRTLAYLLHPPLIDEAGLLASLRWFTRGFQERSGITVKLTAPDELDRLPSELESAVFRIVQEALTNIQRHSGSAVADVRLEQLGRTIRLEIKDEGSGLPAQFRRHPEAMAASGVGIAVIQERARELGGQMLIESEDRGTRIVVNLPIPV